MTRTPQSRRVRESLYDGPSRAYESDSDIDIIEAVQAGIRRRMKANDFRGITLAGGLRDFGDVPRDRDDFAELEVLAAWFTSRLVERERERRGQTAVDVLRGMQP